MTTIIKRGETFRRSLKLTYAETGEIVDLSECTAFSQMRTAPGGRLIETGACTIKQDTGTVYALWTAEKTMAMPTGKYGYDVWVVNGEERKPIYTEEVEVVDPYTDNMPALEVSDVD